LVNVYVLDGHLLLTLAAVAVNATDLRTTFEFVSARAPFEHSAYLSRPQAGGVFRELLARHYRHRPEGSSLSGSWSRRYRDTTLWVFPKGREK
jgi:hypothetical protein